jgi:hypothetical protein
MTSDGQMEYQVEEILDMRYKKQGSRKVKQFLVKWKGHPTYESTWEPEENLKNSREAVQKFLKEQVSDEDVASSEGEAM